MRIRSAPRSAYEGRTKSKEMASADDRTRSVGGAARGWDVDNVNRGEVKTLRWGRRELRDTRSKERYSESEVCSGYVSKLPGTAAAASTELSWDMQRKRSGKARSKQEVVTRGKRRMWQKGNFRGRGRRRDRLRRKEEPVEGEGKKGRREWGDGGGRDSYRGGNRGGDGFRTWNRRWDAV
jgi:hypothetical protein